MSWARPASLGRFDHWLCQCIAALALTGPLLAAEERLCDLPPFDQVVLNDQNKNAVLDVEPLDLAGRQIPDPPPREITVRLLADPTRQFDISWQNIREILFFEQHLLREAQRLTAEGKFDDAFDYYRRLLREYPQLPGLNDAVNDYLLRNSAELQQAGQYERSLAVLGSLYQRNPRAPGLGEAVDAACGRMIEQHLRNKDYAAARGVLDGWKDRFGLLNSQAAAAWEQRFAAAAERQVRQARQDIADKNYLAARRAMGQARAIWPDSREADVLMAEIQRASPTVSVGVFEAAPRESMRRVDDWAALRVNRLIEPMLAEIVDFGSEGGVYRSRFGEWTADDGGLRLSLRLSPPTNGDRGRALPSALVARLLLDAADPARPEYQPEFAEELAGVSVDGRDRVDLDWRHPHVRPEALLQLAPSEMVRGADGSVVRTAVVEPPWIESESGSSVTTFDASPTAYGDPSWLRTIVEQTMADDESAIAALKHGEIDVLDRVPPWHLNSLRATNGILVESYRLPTVHMLVLNPAKPLMREREFRRALCYGIDRERIVKEVLLGGAAVPGYTVLSGPFPAGLSFSDPLRYAYNNQLEPRPFEPRLAAVLANVAWSRILDPTRKGDVEITPMSPLVLAHPADPLARVACQTIQVQLAKAGIPITLVEFTADQLLAGEVEYDLRYAEIAVWEPVVDARRLLGPGGLAGDFCSPYLAATLRELDQAANWKDVRAKLAEIHEIAHHDLPLIPLWQTVNYFAYRAGVEGIGDGPMTLYQNVDRWRVGASGDIAESTRQP